MSDHSAIEWTEATWNPVTGCTRISDGCLRCYIERTPPLRMAGRKFDSPAVGGTTGVQLHPDRLATPLRWRKPRRIFVCSLADLFHEAVPDDFIARVFAVMAQTPQHTYQVLTKRHGRMRSLLDSVEFEWDVFDRQPPGKRMHTPPAAGWPLHNVWLGVSVEDQQWADIRIPALLETPAAVRWLSCEPLLEAVDLTPWLIPWNRAIQHSLDNPTHILGPYEAGFQHVDCDSCDFDSQRGGVDWVVVGGESGLRSRPMAPDWARSLRDQCNAAEVPFFFKQWGGRTPKANGRELDGQTWDEYPAVREAAPA